MRLRLSPVLLCATALAISSPARGEQYFTVQPCRFFDSRTPADGPILSGNAPRFIDVEGVCGVPPEAIAVTVNITVTGATTGGSMLLERNDDPFMPQGPHLSVPFGAGQTRANNGMVQITLGGRPVKGVVAWPFFSSAESAHLLLDVSGFFAP